MSVFYVSPWRQDVLAGSCADAVALQAFARALGGSARWQAKAGLYPDAHGFRVTLTVSRTGDLDGLDAIRALRDYVAERQSAFVQRGDRSIPFIGARAT